MNSSRPRAAGGRRCPGPCSDRRRRDLAVTKRRLKTRRPATTRIKTVRPRAKKFKSRIRSRDEIRGTRAVQASAHCVDGVKPCVLVARPASMEQPEVLSTPLPWVRAASATLSHSFTPPLDPMAVGHRRRSSPWRWQHFNRAEPSGAWQPSPPARARASLATSPLKRPPGQGSPSRLWGEVSTEHAGQ